MVYTRTILNIHYITNFPEGFLFNKTGLYLYILISKINSRFYTCFQFFISNFTWYRTQQERQGTFRLISRFYEAVRQCQSSQECRVVCTSLNLPIEWDGEELWRRNMSQIWLTHLSSTDTDSCRGFFSLVLPVHLSRICWVDSPARPTSR